MKNQRARKNINFKQTKSERSATASYRNFGSYIKNISKFVKIPNLSSFGGKK